jgi:hypothetical protein
MEPLDRRRKALLRAMLRIERMEHGVLGEFYQTRRVDGKTVKTGPYYKRQVWQGGKNVTEYIPSCDVEEVREAIQGRERFEKLAAEWVRLTVQKTRSERGET